MPFDGIVTKAVTEELQANLLPGRITKIYQPTDTELVFTIRSKGKNHSLLLSVHPVYARFHLTKERYPNPQEPPMFCMFLRKYLSGAMLTSVAQYGMERIVCFDVETKNEIGDVTHLRLIVELMGKHSNLMLVEKEKGHILDSIKHIGILKNRYRTVLPGSEYKLPPAQNKQNPLEINGDVFLQQLDFNAGKLDKQIVNRLTGISPFIARELVRRANLGSPQDYKMAFEEIQQDIINQQYLPAIYQDKKEDYHVLQISSFNGEIHTFTSPSDMLDAFYSGKAQRDRVKQQAKDLYRIIHNELNKNERKLKKHHQQTVSHAQDAGKYQRLGELLTANMHLVKKGDSEITVINYYDPEQAEVVIPLDPHKTPSENAQHYFKKYQKLKNSKVAMQKEMEKTKEDITYFEQLLQQIDVAGDEDIEEIRDELRDEGFLKKQPRRNHKNKQGKPKLEKYVSTDGTPILVGKNNRQNEYLTMKLAHHNEVWLHTKDIPGSHVVIRATEPSEKTILEAAQLAAYFSKSQQSASVPVDYTKIRYVKKPNGAKPGFVTYTNQKTVFVTPTKEMVQKLKQK
ncbi:NFACT RNA binding domain-containing protein [Virgibacillus sp. 179-BFC.A HS]|uniref:Rqc2 homolog RqcH n=1 Tax=Tigheibacillus jepli TaxID=3035914 RepID=A0ABU5CI85_9BACI|nr:NFACT RNA binding domain-containing protein [Virgibacillus sp. 179-BFC.A HS]MDY0405935.1 NFACT RNA binding domain-containing protein [Virgibacillus sp. 179-BFC.A HS]